MSYKQDHATIEMPEIPDMMPATPDDAINAVNAVLTMRDEIHEYLAQVHAQSAPIEPQHLVEPPATKVLMAAFSDIENGKGQSLYLILMRSCIREACAALMVRRIARELSIVAVLVADEGVLAPIEMDTIERQIQHLSSYIGSARDATGEIGVACASDVGVAKLYVDRLRDQKIQCELLDDNHDTLQTARAFIVEMIRRLDTLEKASFIGHTQ